MALQPRGPRDPHQFPGALGRKFIVRSNLFDMDIRPNTIGQFEIYGVLLRRNSTPVPVESKKLFSLFKNAFANELQEYEIVEGYPTEHGLFVYTVPSYPFNEFPEREWTEQSRGLRQGQQQQQQQRPPRTFKVWAEFRGNVKVNEWQKYDSELRQFLKRAALQNIAQMFTSHGYQLLKKGIYSFERDPRRARFPLLPLNDIFEVASGFKIGFELNVPNPDGTSRNMMAIDLTQNVITRTNVPLFKCYVSLCAFPHQVSLHPRDLQGQLLKERDVRVLNRVLANMEVYIQGEKQTKDHPVYYKFVKILGQSSTNVQDRNGRTIVQFYEERFRIKLENTFLNAVELKCGPRSKHVPLELVVLSDRPQRLCVAAMSILTELNNKIREMAAVVPGPRWEFIESIAGKLSTELEDPTKTNLLKSIGIHINNLPIDICARVLDEPLDSAYTAPFTLAFPYKDRPIEYVVVDFHRQYRDEELHTVRKDVDVLMDKLYENFGIYVYGKRSANYFKFEMANYDRDLSQVVGWHFNEGIKNLKDARNLLLYIVVVDQQNDDLYGRIKHHFDNNGMINQVITLPILQKVRPSYRNESQETAREFSFNIALQINSKIGGINFTPSDNREDLWEDDELIMFMGIDTRLSHQKGKIGLIAIMTSYNLQGTGYNAFVTTTDGIRKYCGDYTHIIRNALDSYRAQDGTKVFPKKIVIFRAGMSEYDLSNGEGKLEIGHIQHCIGIYMRHYGIGGPLPKITYIGYHRSHGVRFFDPNVRVRKLINDTDPEGVKENVPIGTVIDHDVTNENCFYFISHETFMGTVKPAKYTIVTDEINFTADNLLAMVYQLCRLMPQTKRSFRRPVPIGLASKLLERCIRLRPDWTESMDKNQEFDINPVFRNLPFYI